MLPSMRLRHTAVAAFGDASRRRRCNFGACAAEAVEGRPVPAVLARGPVHDLGALAGEDALVEHRALAKDTALHNLRAHTKKKASSVSARYLTSDSPTLSSRKLRSARKIRFSAAFGKCLPRDRSGTIRYLALMERLNFWSCDQE